MWAIFNRRTGLFYASAGARSEVSIYTTPESAEKVLNTFEKQPDDTPLDDRDIWVVVEVEVKEKRGLG